MLSSLECLYCIGRRMTFIRRAASNPIPGAKTESERKQWPPAEKVRGHARPGKNLQRIVRRRAFFRRRGARFRAAAEKGFGDGAIMRRGARVKHFCSGAFRPFYPERRPCVP